MKKCVREFMLSELPAQGARVLVGVSGGADSVCLLFLLDELRREGLLSIHVLHVHHGIRGEEADADMAFVERLCVERKLPLSVVRADVPKLATEWQLGLEEAGRRVRYEAFAEYAQKVGADAVCVAHHRDDLAETVLFRLLRGTGVRGVSGIPACSYPFANTKLPLLRPLLRVSRAEIEAYLTQRGIPYCIDSTNADSAYTRNYVRNVLIPACETVNVRAKEHLASFAEQMEPLLRLLDSCLEKALPCCIDDEGLRIAETMALPEAVQTALVHRFVSEQTGTAKDITERHVVAVRELLTAEVSKEVHLPYGITLVRGYEHIICKKDAGQAGTKEALFQTMITQFPADVRLSDGGRVHFEVFPYENSMTIPKNLCTKWLDYDKIRGDVCVRGRRSGDYMVISVSGHRTMLQDMLVNLKIPKEGRDSMALVACDSEILWIPGVRGSEAYRITSDTKKVLQITWQEAL